MKWPRLVYVLLAILLLTACNNGSAYNTVPNSPTPIKQTAEKLTPTPTAVPVVQQSLPKGLLKPGYPVLDWVFSISCSQAINSFDNSSMNATLAYDSAAWLYPSDGHLVTGGQGCD